MKFARQLTLCCIITFSGILRADTLYVSSGGGAIQIKDAKVTNIENGNVLFTTATGSSSREISKVQRMQIDNEPAFNAAEEAAAVAKWDAAVEGYLKTISATSKSWLRDFTQLKLLEAAQKAGRFDAAASAYV